MRTLPRKQQHPEILSASGHYEAFVRGASAWYGGAPLRSSGQVEAFLRAHFAQSFDSAFNATIYALGKWAGCSRPVYFLERELAETLVHTEVPMRTFDLPAWLPDESMYVSCPPLFELENPASGMHPVEGFYLVRDTMGVLLDAEGRRRYDTRKSLPGEPAPTVSSGDPGVEMVEGITCIGVGKDRSRDPRVIDDALVVFHLVPGVPLDEHSRHSFAGIHQLERVVVNLLYAMQRTSSVVREQRQPELDPRHAGRRPGRAEKLLRDSGTTVAPYTVLSLSKKTRSAAPAAQPEGVASVERKLRHPKLISGHFHRYWVADPGDETVLDTRQGKASTLYLVEYLLAPYVQGADLPAPAVKTVLVVR